MTLGELNALRDGEAAQVFTACCGANRWVLEMVRRRPYSSIDHVVDTANIVWCEAGENDWREAFDHHPRIGEVRSAAAQDQRAAGWSSSEQSGAAVAQADAKRALAAMNAKYEARFGHIYLVCATGLSADALLAIARSRLDNDPATELRVAAEEQRKITELRLRKLLTEAP